MLALVFSSIGRSVVRHPRLTLVVWVVITGLGFALALFGVHGQSVFDRVTTGEPTVPGSQSARAVEILAQSAETGPSITLVVTGVDPADPALAEVMAGVNKDLAAIEGVVVDQGIVNPYVFPDGLANPNAQHLLAADGRGFLVDVVLRPDLDDDQEASAATAVTERLEAVAGDVRDGVPSASEASGIVSSTALIVDAITGQVQQDLQTGEAVALPIALLVMVVVFGGFLAAAMPMAGAVASIGAGLGALLGITYLMDVDATVVNVVTLLGLGLSIDYGLLIVSRFREELHHQIDAEQRGDGPGRRRGDAVVQSALIRTMETAGRTVAFSALTVAISIAGLMVFRPEILRSVGAGGLAVVLIAVATALTLVPALLAFSGRRLAKPSALGRVPGLRRVLARTSDVQSDEGIFSRLAGRVQRHPLWVLLGTVAILAALAAPVLGLQMRNSTIQLLPVDSPQRQFVTQIEDDYPTGGTPSMRIVAEASIEDAEEWAADLADLDGVESVDAPTASGAYAVLAVHLDSEDAGGPEAIAVVHDVRAQDPGFDFWVAGPAANQIDFLDSLAERVWWAVGIVVLATLVLLFLMTGSVVIPIKALLTNALSLAASLGVLVWVFQEGHLEGLLAFTSTGGIETYVIALVVAFAFGLAMDYEVFLLARVKEFHDAGHPNDEAVRLGLQRSGRIITSAAAIIVVVFAGFVFGDLLVIKEVGFALAVAVLIDATIVRLLLVPATMTLLGRWNWWAPRPLRAVYARMSIAH